MTQAPARVRTTLAESERNHVRDSIKTLAGATPTFIRVTMTLPPLITTITLKVRRYHVCDVIMKKIDALMWKKGHFFEVFNYCRASYLPH